MNRFGRCKRCKRPLKDQESIQIGYGPICRGKEQQDDGQLSLFDYEKHAPTEFESYQALLRRQVEKEWNKVLVT